MSRGSGDETRCNPVESSVGTLACNLKLLLEAAVAACFEGWLPGLELVSMLEGWDALAFWVSDVEARTLAYGLS